MKPDPILEYACPGCLVKMHDAEVAGSKIWPEHPAWCHDCGEAWDFKDLIELKPMPSSLPRSKQRPAAWIALLAALAAPAVYIFVNAPKKQTTEVGIMVMNAPTIAGSSLTVSGGVLRTISCDNGVIDDGAIGFSPDSPMNVVIDCSSNYVVVNDRPALNFRVAR